MDHRIPFSIIISAGHAQGMAYVGRITSNENPTVSRGDIGAFAKAACTSEVSAVIDLCDDDSD